MGAAAPKLKSPTTMESPPSSFTCHTCQPRHTCPHTFHACPQHCQDKCGCEGASTPVASTPEDAFMSAVLAFCSHMSGRLDSLDNSSIYDEFRNYTAAAQKVAVS